LTILGAKAAVVQDKRGSVSILVEIDPFWGSDRHDTNGIKANWLSAEDAPPRFGRWLARNPPFLSNTGGSA